MNKTQLLKSQEPSSPNVMELINEIDQHLAELQKLAMTMNQWRRHKFMQHITMARHELKKLRIQLLKQVVLRDLLTKLGENS